MSDDPVGGLHRCWLAYRRWSMVILRGNIKHNECYAINFYAIRKQREELEMSE